MGYKCNGIFQCVKDNNLFYELNLLFFGLALTNVIIGCIPDNLDVFL